jgi:hypothetical protein
VAAFGFLAVVDFIGDGGSEVGFGEFWMVIGWERGWDVSFLLLDVCTCLLSSSDDMYSVLDSLFASC